MAAFTSCHYPSLPPSDHEKEMSAHDMVSSSASNFQLLGESDLLSFDDPSPSNQEQSTTTNGMFPVSMSVPMQFTEICEEFGDIEPEKANKGTKLGYQRASIACSHCRRRKIRCIASLPITQGPCINCLHLKKECSLLLLGRRSDDSSRTKPVTRSSTTDLGGWATTFPVTTSGSLVEMQGTSNPGFGVHKMESISAAAHMSIDALKAGDFSQFSPGMREHPTEQWSSVMAAQSLYDCVYPNTNQRLTTGIEELDEMKHIHASGTQLTSLTPTSLLSPMSVPGRSNSVSHSTTDSAWGTFVHPVRSMSHQEGSFAAYNTVQGPMMIPDQQLGENFSEFSDIQNASMNGVIPGSETGARYNIEPALTLPVDTDLLVHHPMPNEPQLNSRYTLTSDLNTYATAWSN